ncbi:hypothetical protein M885DRAFT_505406 [Pelagophyceae sp. CCMP2097]|nr:hypothetical protein M885DRAFT_505406 [Pelagophyceae sp. CCMP2097]|mmetsp:Transcript_7492/g.26173  ORF Transcript_7492/g.26173 Transcript_7492/m.26173 type:complete len:304 (-) Transcript_7492:275-1186(-)
MHQGIGYAVALTAVPTATMLLLAALVSRVQPPPITMAALQHLAAGIVLSAVAVELVPIISNAESNMHNNSAIAFGFCAGVGLFVCVGLVCAPAAEKEEAEAADNVDDYGSRSPPRPTHELKRRASKVGQMRDRMDSDSGYYVSADDASVAAKKRGFPWTMLVAVTIDALCDGFLIGLSAASGTSAGVIMSAALTIEMGFLSLTFATTLKGLPRWMQLVTNLLPPTTLMLGGVLGAATALVTLQHAPLHVGLISFGVAALLYLVTEELLLQAHESQGPEEHIWWVDLCFFVGFLASFLLDKLLK